MLYKVNSKSSNIPPSYPGKQSCGSCASFRAQSFSGAMPPALPSVDAGVANAKETPLAIMQSCELAGQNLIRRDFARRLGVSTFGHQNNRSNTDTRDKERKYTPILFKSAVVGASVAGVLAVLTLLSRGKKGADSFLNNKRFCGDRLSEIEDFNMFKFGTYSNLVKKMRYSALDAVVLALGSVVGGLGVGLLFDKEENKEAKIKEAVSQVVGNVIFPLGSIFGAIALVNKATTKEWIAPNLSRPAKLASCIAALVIGVIGGNKIANAINSKVFKKSDDREIKLQDLFSRVDDGCVVAGLIGKGVKLCEMIARVIPLVLIIPGVAIGFAKEGQDKGRK